MSDRPKHQPCSCIICRNEFSNFGGLQSHYNTKHLNIELRRRIPYSCISCKETRDDVSSLSLHSRKCDRLFSICTCRECGVEYVNRRSSIHCSISCSAISGNRSRKERGWVMSTETKNKIRAKLRSPTWEEIYVWGDYTRISEQICKDCGIPFLRKTSRPTTICMCCRATPYSDIYRFKFNVYDYPDMFDLSWIEEIGWFSQGGNNNAPYNPSGLSRDHKVSVFEAHKNRYDPYYISHPVNCEIMLHSDNNKKKTRSSITYDELRSLVDAYDHRGVG